MGNTPQAPGVKARKQAFARRLKKGINHAGMLHKEFAVALGLGVGHGPATVSAWLNGDNPTLPNGARMMIIPVVLGVDGHWLLTGEGHMLSTRDEPSDADTLNVLREMLRPAADKSRQHAAILAAAATLRSLPDPLGRAGSEDEVGGPSGEDENNDGETTPPAKKKHRK